MRSFIDYYYIENVNESFSIPNDFQKLIKDLIGNESDSFFASLQSDSPTSVRYNRDKFDLPLGLQRVPWADSGVYLDKRPVFTLDPHLHAGRYYVQEASSMFLEQAVKTAIGDNQKIIALDLCAAPGGKSTHLLSLISDNSLLVSNEVIRSRVPILIENLQKWGNPNVIVTSNDPAGFQRLPSFFDLIVVDAPCSGEGLFRKDNEAMKEWSLANVELCSSRQRRILSDVWPSLKPGGVLIYSTCTYNLEEDEKNIEWLSQQNNVESLRVPISPDWGIKEIDHKGLFAYKFFPHRVTGEGFFISVLQRKSGATSRNLPKQNRRLGKLSKSEVALLDGWIAKDGVLEVFKFNDQINAIPTNTFQIVELLSSILNVQVAGTPVATVKHNKMVPEHAFALSKCINRDNFIQTELGFDDAIKYLRRDNLQIDTNQKGFSLVTYQNQPIGWLNLLGNRVNNLYPSNWRIRMNPNQHQ
ncbi:MAG: rRNA methyltransferase [Cyclobacteriaceae bacterium]|nr:rRNA methyltransferase [Cyclobacteriaceae bacterium]